LTGTGGTAQSTATGTVANSTFLTNANSGGASAAGSNSTGSDGRPIQTITVGGTYTGNGKSIVLFQDVVTPSNATTGDTLEGQACVNIGANTNVADVNVELFTVESATNFKMDGAKGVSTSPFPTAGWANGGTVCILTPRRTLTAVPTKIEIDVVVDLTNQAGTVAVAATVNVQSVSVKKVTP
jgi:hypothetical protein